MRLKLAQGCTPDKDRDRGDVSGPVSCCEVGACRYPIIAKNQHGAQHRKVAGLLRRVLTNPPPFFCALLQNGKTALMAASKEGHSEVVQMLLLAGVNKDAAADKVSYCGACHTLDLHGVVFVLRS